MGWVSCSLFLSHIKSIPTHEKIVAVGKSGPNATFNLIFLGLGLPWVGEFIHMTVVNICVFLTVVNICVFFNPTEFGISQTP